MSFTRTAAIAGIVLVILLIVNAVLLGNPPMIDEDTEEIQKYLKGNGDMHKIGALVGFAVLPLFAVFLAGIVRPIRASDQEHDEGWAVVVLAGAIVLAAVATMGGVLQAALFFRGRRRNRRLDRTSAVGRRDGGVCRHRHRHSDAGWRGPRFPSSGMDS